MAAPQTLETMLAALPEEDLLAMRDREREEATRLKSDLTRVEVQVDLIERALAKRSRQVAGHKGGDTRESVLHALRDRSDVISPADIIAELRAHGSTVKSGAIRAMIRRLVSEGLVNRVGDGEYRLASSVAPSDDDAIVIDDADFAFPTEQKLDQQASPNGAEPVRGEREGTGLQVPAG